ncbi:hypothetical protein Tco_1274962 [Tanacetum coccineum]
MSIGLMDKPDDVVFRIHYNGVFKYDPLSLSGIDEEVTSRNKKHGIKKKDAGYMYVEELVVWAKEEANSPYLRFPPLKCRPFRNDMKSKVLFIDMYCHEDEGFIYYPSLNDDEVGKDNLVLRSCDLENEGMNDVAKTLEGMNDVVDGRIECIKGMNDAAKSVEFMDVVDVLTRQNKLDDGKRPMTDDDIVTSKKRKNSCRGNDVSIRENDKLVFSDNESDYDENVDEYAHMFFESESDESDKSFDYLSNGEDEDMRPNVDKFVDVDDNCFSLTPLIREHEKYIEVLLRKLKGNGMGIRDPFAIVEKSKDMYPIYDDMTQWKLKKPKLSKKFPNIEKFKECLTYYALANGFL